MSDASYNTVMLGWTEKSLLYIKEIINANESEGGGIIAVLCERGKEQMDRELGHYLKKKDMQGTKVRAVQVVNTSGRP